MLYGHPYSLLCIECARFIFMAGFCVTYTGNKTTTSSSSVAIMLAFKTKYDVKNVWPHITAHADSFNFSWYGITIEISIMRFVESSYPFRRIVILRACIMSWSFKFVHVLLLWRIKALFRFFRVMQEKKNKNILLCNLR